jgi:hypothetical protein
MWPRFAVSLALGLAACSEKTPAPAEPQPPTAVPVPADAGAPPVVVSGFDPSGMHLDDDHGYRPAGVAVAAKRPGRPIDVILRSTPPGAMVSVDGASLGPTPTHWAGLADGREHEFVFVLRGHAVARYRFVPITSGVIHATLEPIIEARDAGVPPPEVVPPTN